MADKGKEVDIPNPEDRPFPWRNQDVGHITGTPPQQPPPNPWITSWFH